MKNSGYSQFGVISVLFLVLFSVNFNLNAQTPQFYNSNNGTSYNSFPLNVPAGKMVQTLIAAGEFNQPAPAPSGNITKFYLLISPGYPLGPATYTSFRILFSQAAITVLPSGSFYSGTWDTVYMRANVTLSAAADTWLAITLDHPYPYNPALGLIVQIEQCGATGTLTGYSVKQTSTPGVGRRSYSSGTCPYVYGGLTTSVVNCGIDVGSSVPSGSWTEQTSGLTTALYSVSAVNDAVAWVGGAGSKVLRTINSGSTWTNAAGNLPAAQDVYCVWGFDANNCVITTSPAAGTYIYKTTNGGTNWTQTFFQAGGFMDGFYFYDSNTGFAYGDPVGTRWSLFKTTNGGVNWDSTGCYVPAGGLAGWNNAMFGRGPKIWFGTNGTPLWYTPNGGLSWTSQTTPAINQYAIWFNDDNVGLSGGANLNVTTNGGVNWTALTSIGTGNVSGITGAATSWWFTRQATAVNYSSNNGTSWTAQYTAPAGSFYHLTLSRSGATIWGVRANGGISRYGQTTGITPVNSEVPSAYNLSQNYPNPFNPVTKISYSLPENGFVKLTVYDALGRTVSNLVNENKVAGIYSVDFNAVSLPSGVYFYRLEVNGFSETMKMLIIK